MPRLKTDNDYLGTSRAARYLGVHRSTLVSWRRRGHLKPTAIVSGPRGRLFKFSVDDLERFREKIEYDG